MSDSHKKESQADPCSKGTRTWSRPCKLTTADVWSGSILVGKLTTWPKKSISNVFHIQVKYFKATGHHHRTFCQSNHTNTINNFTFSRDALHNEWSNCWQSRWLIFLTPHVIVINKWFPCSHWCHSHTPFHSYK
jgi:hypothetical protein